MVRDLARSLGKKARLDLVGLDTPVDRDVLERLEAPLGHLIRNAIDHGIEMPSEREAAGKTTEGTIRIEARHSAGQLLVIVSDDGRGISLEHLRQSVVKRGLAQQETAARLTEAELLEFLFLPGFTLSQTVTEISGRGIGLDAVQDTLRKVRGSVRISTQSTQGSKFQLQLPLTLSVVRTLIVEIAGEPYAIPLTQILRAARISADSVETLEGRPHFRLADRPTGLVAASRLIRGQEAQTLGPQLSVVVIGSRDRTYGLMVDSLVGECELVVQTLDPRLGKVQDVAAAAVMEDGTPVLILDVEDLIRSIDKLAVDGDVRRAAPAAKEISSKARRVLVVDDSLTVRELERKLLANAGYEVQIATDGMDGWNAVRAGQFDLVITDVDMPRVDGIELVNLIRSDPHLKTLPVMIVSYKDRPEDRQRGLDAGADHYLAKAGFHDAALLDAVRDLIGAAA
jgi:two-component system sensor histidine kinase and response regulator WspE